MTIGAAPITRPFQACRLFLFVFCESDWASIFTFSVSVFNAPCPSISSTSFSFHFAFLVYFAFSPSSSHSFAVFFSVLARPFLRCLANAFVPSSFATGSGTSASSRVMLSSGSILICANLWVSQLGTFVQRKSASRSSPGPPDV